MASIKLKLRPSTVTGNSGTLFFQIIQQRQVRQIFTGLHILDAEWDVAGTSVITPPDADSSRAKYLASIRISLKEQTAKLAGIVADFDSKGSDYTVGDIVAAFNKPLVVTGVASFSRKLIDDMKRIGKHSAVKRFSATLSSLLRYTGDNDIAWNELTSTFILGYEEFLMKRGLCRNSTSFYMRNLRSILNRAADENFAVPLNPFKHVYMGVDRTAKRAVTIDTVRKIRDLDLTRHPSLSFARNIFMFAFYTRGMSFVDIAFLKKSDMHNGVITYFRRKTRQQIMVKIEPETLRIIDSLGRSDTQYLLPIITDEKADIERQYQNAYSRVNRNIRKIGEMLGLETKLTLYVARHAWASIALSNNVAISTISKAMGHDSEKTTVIYLRSLDSSSVDKANSDIIKLMDRKNKR